MPAVERAGYTVTMFLIDTSPSMAALRTVHLPPDPSGEEHTAQITNLQWGLQFVKLKIQEMIFNGRKTDQCGVILFGSKETKNIINGKNGGYEHVSEYIPIGQPNAKTLSKIDALKPSSVCGDPIDALIVGIETQAEYLASKKTWTRKIIILTDGESSIETEDWEATVEKMNALNISLTVVGIDFDEEDISYTESNKTAVKRANEEFFHQLTSSLNTGIVGTCALALQETTKPDIKQTRSTLMGTILRLGDIDTRPDEALEIAVKTSKCTALSRPKSWKKFALQEPKEDDMELDLPADVQRYSQLKMRTEYLVDKRPRKTIEDNDGDVNMDDDEDMLDEQQKLTKEKERLKLMQPVDREALVRGFKYGTTYVPCPDGQFPRLSTRKGIDICGFFPYKNFRRELSMGEIQYIWADPSSPHQQVALSSIVQGMAKEELVAIARWVTKDGMDPKMGVLSPSEFDKVDCLLWAQMPFADDVRKYTFASLDNLVSKKGEVLKEHPYLPTEEQLGAMDDFVDALDLMEAGEKDENGDRQSWFDPRFSYNPAIHRVKQAMFHAAVVSDIQTNPIPPPHPELVKYFDPPRRVLKRANDAVEQCINVFNVKKAPKRVARARKDGHVRADEEDESMLLLDHKAPKHLDKTQSQMQTSPQSRSTAKTTSILHDSETEDEDEDEEMLLDMKKTSIPAPSRVPISGDNSVLPTPAHSLSPEVDPGLAPGRIIGTTYPLKDFHKNIAQGDVVSKAVEDLGAVIKDVVMRPFASRRSKEMMECMRTLRDTCLQEDEVRPWNEFLTELKAACLSKSGNRDFWSDIQKAGTSIGLISSTEAKLYGGESNVSETEAAEFIA